MDAVGTVLTSTIADALGLVTDNVPAILGVAAVFVAIKFGKRILGKI